MPVRCIPPYGSVTAQELRHALEQLLNTPLYRQNAGYIGKTLIDAGGYLHAVEEIENYI